MERVHNVSLKRSNQRSNTAGANSFARGIKAELGSAEYLREDEINSMRGNDRAAEDISDSLLKSAGSPIIEPNPHRLSNQNRAESSRILPPPYQPISVPERPTLLICPICGELFDLEQNFRRHLKIHQMA